MSRKTRNLIWSAPLVAAVAVIGALALFVALAPNDAAAQTSSMVPGIPGNLVATGDSPTSVDLTWDAPTDGDTPDGYRLDYSEDGAVWFSLAANHTSTAYTHSGLKERQTISYRVFASNTVGTSGVSQIAMATTKISVVPDAPGDFVAANNIGVTDAARTEIVLTWDAPDNPDGAPVTKYTIQVSSNGRSYGHLKDISAKDASCATVTTCTYTHKELLENTPRWYYVYATNSVGTSKASLSDDGMTAEGETPNPPEGLRAGLNRSGRMVLYWDAPTEDGTADRHEPAGAPITGYYVQGGPVASITDPTFVTVPTGVAGEISTSRLYPAGAKTSVPLTSSNVLSKFRQPNNNPDGDATTADGEVWGFRVAAVNRVVERNLSDGTIEADDLEWPENIVRVNHRARDVPPVRAGIDENGDSTDAAANDTDDMVERPTLTGKKVSNVNGGRTSIELKWKAGRNEETDDVNTTPFWLEYSTDGIDWTVITAAAGGNASLTATHENRVAGTTYYYRVFAKHENPAVGAPTNSVRSEASSEVTVTTAPADTPDAPTLNSAEPESEEEIELEWTAPQPTSAESTAGLTSAGFAAVGYGKITAYKVEVSEDGTNWSQLVEIKSPKQTLTYTWDNEKNELSTKAKNDNGRITLIHASLSQGETKYYRVSTVNNAPTNKATSVPSNGLKAKTDGALIADSPGGLVVKAEGLSAFKLLWNARASDIAAAPVTGYKIEVSPLNSDGDDCAEQWSDLVEDSMSTTTSYDHTGLMPDTGRCYRVFGINDVAVSTSFVGYGDPYPATKDNDAIATTDPAVVPGMPMNVMAMATSDTAITVEWEAPADNGGADITGYMVESAYMMADDTMSEWMAVDPAHSGMMMEYMDMGLMPETMYYYRVAAMNSVGMGEYSDGMDMATTETSDTAPGVPTAVTAMETSDTEITVTWGSPASDGGADITGYMVQRAYMGADNMMSEWMAVDPAHMGMDMMYMDTGLMPETMYYYQVRAMNAVGNGEWSGGMASAMTDPTPVMTELGMATNLRSGFNSGGTIQVTWDPADNAVGYIVIAIDKGDLSAISDPVNPDSSGVTQTTLNLGGLTVGREYNIYVAATGSAGDFTLSAPLLDVTAR